ncbi:tumor necrosis factor receptor superfamily member 11A-like protein [Lates japonicus]|uniref:Tumor necrosis factor receptor superfamily member 11A-like protein n=1 Tax=Lates japonicus TaxID=270547 RepID=A0AAD3MJC7_LATJO|nr:tumor necrosis factor receptor superfamily member 11A-like protein [Lates japonicus]
MTNVLSTSSGTLTRHQLSTLAGFVMMDCKAGGKERGTSRAASQADAICGSLVSGDLGSLLTIVEVPSLAAIQGGDDRERWKQQRADWGSEEGLRTREEWGENEDCSQVVNPGTQHLPMCGGLDGERDGDEREREEESEGKKMVRFSLTTFISSGQVMNFTMSTVVYVSQSSLRSLRTCFHITAKRLQTPPVQEVMEELPQESEL